MPPSKIAAVVNGQEMCKVAAGAVDLCDEFQPSVWGDFFITYVPPIISQGSEEWMRERAELLEGQVQQAFNANLDTMAVADLVTYVDTLERLGLDNHLPKVIQASLNRIRAEEPESDDGLHIVALCFRLLRQHGIWVPADVFDKYRDDTVSFSSSLGSDPRGILSLYNAAHMAVPSELVLDDAIAFARGHLKEIKGKVRSPLSEQMSRALDIALPRFSRWLEIMHYVGEYEHEEAHDSLLLELARLNFNLVRAPHLRELKDLSVWWRDLYNTVKLPYARESMVEIYFQGLSEGAAARAAPPGSATVYFWTCGMLHEEEYSLARMFFAKTFGMVSLMDDTFDVHATLEECHKLTKAMQRWDESEVSILPQYLRMLYVKTLSNFKEFEDILEPNKKYRMAYTKEAYKLCSINYLQEAIWSSQKYQPSFKEHQELSIMTSGLPMLTILTLMGYGDGATQEAFGWVSSVPEMVRAGSQVTRFLNDLSSYKLGKHKKDMPSSVETYMVENVVTAEEAVAAIIELLENRWRILNKASIDTDNRLLPATQVVVNMSRANEIIYLHGRDAYTFGADVKDLVTKLFLEQVPL